MMHKGEADGSAIDPMLILTIVAQQSITFHLLQSNRGQRSLYCSLIVVLMRGSS